MERLARELQRHPSGHWRDHPRREVRWLLIAPTNMPQPPAAVGAQAQAARGLGFLPPLSSGSWQDMRGHRRKRRYFIHGGGGAWEHLASGLPSARRQPPSPPPPASEGSSWLCCRPGVVAGFSFLRSPTPPSRGSPAVPVYRLSTRPARPCSVCCLLLIKPRSAPLVALGPCWLLEVAGPGNSNRQ
jgi:hypothetical protein